MSDVDSATQPAAAFRSARAAAEEHMARMDQAGSTWHETTVTDIVLTTAHPIVKFADFNQNQEGTTGADWLWWWVDSTGEAFGMLVQAKRLKVGKRWTIDFTYPDGTGNQQRKLFVTANELNVAPVYALYLGTQAYRGPATCGLSDHDNDDCLRCRMATVSVLPAIIATTGGGLNGDDDAEYTIRHSFPLETLGDPTHQPVCRYDLNLRLVDDALRDFLLQPQQGARLIAKTLFERVSSVRRLQFSAATLDKVAGDTAQVFHEYPSDRGHLGVPYYEHILRGLRVSAPSYVLDLLADQPLPPEVSSKVAGIVVVHL